MYWEPAPATEVILASQNMLSVYYIFIGNLSSVNQGLIYLIHADIQINLMPIEKGNLIVKIVKSQYFGKMLLMLSCNHFFICLFLFYEINSFKKWDTPLWISGDGWVRKSFSSRASNSNHTKNSYPFPTPPFPAPPPNPQQNKQHKKITLV